MRSTGLSDCFFGANRRIEVGSGNTGMEWARDIRWGPGQAGEGTARRRYTYSTDQLASLSVWGRRGTHVGLAQLEGG